MPDGQTTITQADESEMTIEGFLAFLDPPKESATEALRELEASHIEIKILTGDRLAVTSHVSNIVGLHVRGTLTGTEIEAMTDDELSTAVESTTIFAKLNPLHK
jgi:Mg2+-importing ATPase